MRSRLAFFGLAFISIVVFSISVGKNLGETTTQGTTLGLQGKLAQTSCEPPQSGCPEGKYWDSIDCACESESSGSCQEPSGGCGTDYYWDSGSCSCEFYCPPEDCGTDQYWDSSSCSCVSSNGGDGGVGGTCSEPVVGCGDGWYWNASTCTCETSCYEPSEGCATGTYWSYTSCSCISDCSPPSEGCANGYYWDYSSCHCKSNYDDGSCTEPVGGCGGGFYWESYDCSCKPTSTCTPPSSGCLTNNYWDSYDCMCKPSCYEPTGGCGENTYWDFYQCSCISYNDANYYSGYEEEDFDRLAYESEEIISCIKGILTQSEYEILRYQIGTTEEQRNEKRLLGDKVMSCWGGGDGYESTSGPPPSIEGEKCLIDGMGETAYQEVYQGKREPTHDEHLWFEKCYGEVRFDSVSYYRDDQNLPVEVDNCLRSVLVGGLYQKVKSGQLDVPSELRGRVDECFGADPQPFEEGRSYELPGEVKSCLIQAVGQSRFNEINSGQSEPTDEEMKKGNVCFGKLNEDQVKFLPPPPEQVPYLVPDPETIEVAGVLQDTRKVRDKVIGGKVVFSGKGPPGSTVSIYIFSEPIVVTTTTDENGDWVYELNQPLEGERHVAYATVRNQSGDIVRSSIFDFTVAAAEPGAGQLLREEGKAAAETSRFLTYALVLIAFVVVTAGGGGAYLFLKRSRPGGGSGNLPGNGKSKGNTSSGSVN